MTFVRKSWKAWVTILVTGLITFIHSLEDGLLHLESARSAGLSLLSGFLVWITPNHKKKPDISKPGVVRKKATGPLRDGKGRFVRDQRGESVVGLLLVILGAVLFVFGALSLVISLLTHNQLPTTLIRDVILIVVGLILLGTRYYNFDTRGRRTRL